jgi:hypothetical protein
MWYVLWVKKDKETGTYQLWKTGTNDLIYASHKANQLGSILSVTCDWQK